MSQPVQGHQPGQAGLEEQRGACPGLGLVRRALLAGDAMGCLEKAFLRKTEEVPSQGPGPPVPIEHICPP